MICTAHPILFRLLTLILLTWRMAGHVARMGERRGVYRISVGKPEGKRPLARPMCTWKDNMI